MPRNWALRHIRVKRRKRRTQQGRLRRGFQGGRRQQAEWGTNPAKLPLAQGLVLQGLRTGTGLNDRKVIGAPEEQFWLSGAGESEGVRGEKSEQVRTLLRSFAAKGSQDMVAAGEECELQRSRVFFFVFQRWETEWWPCALLGEPGRG